MVGASVGSASPTVVTPSGGVHPAALTTPAHTDPIERRHLVRPILAFAAFPLSWLFARAITRG
jgi:hypothetical protein